MSPPNNARIEGIRFFSREEFQVDFKDLYEGPRYEKRAKNRRFNKLLNLGIALVFVLILFFTYKLIFGSNGEPASTEVSPETSVNNGKDVVAGDDQTEEETNEDVESTDTDESSAEDDTEVTEEEETNTEQATKETEVAVENSEDPNVKETIVNKAWKPIGTTQSEPHVATYDSESTDWQEMLKTIEYATGLTQQDWILWRIGNGGSPHHAQGVVSTKDRKYVYRVQMEWVKSEGWMPTKLETLNEVPPEYTGAENSSESTATTEEASEE
jgi:hypothetical protein